LALLFLRMSGRARLDLGRVRGAGLALAEDGVDGFASGLEEAGVGGVLAGGGAEGAAVGIGVGVGGGLWVGGDGSVVLGELGGLGDEVVGGCECLVAELLADCVAAGGVDGGGVCDGLFVVLGLGDDAELGEGKVVELADARWREGGVEEVVEEDGGRRGIRDSGLGIRGRGGAPSVTALR
jgi:hypothetical protein